MQQPKSNHEWKDNSGLKGVLAAKDLYYENIRKKFNDERRQDYNRILSEVGLANFVIFFLLKICYIL